MSVSLMACSRCGVFVPAQEGSPGRYAAGPCPWCVGFTSARKEVTQGEGRQAVGIEEAQRPAVVQDGYILTLGLIRQRPSPAPWGGAVSGGAAPTE
jgi:hypothetical protein